MLKQAKREERLARKRAKKKIDGSIENKKVMHDIHKPITLEDLTNPDKAK